MAKLTIYDLNYAGLCLYLLQGWENFSNELSTDFTNDRTFLGEKQNG